MKRSSHVLTGIILLALFFTVGVVSAAETANLSVSKVVSSAGPYETGRPVTWIITLTNEGPADATNISLAEDISEFSGQVDMSGTADLGTYNNTSKAWNIGKLVNASHAHLTVVTVFNTSGEQTNNADILGLDQTSHGITHADAFVVINNAGAVVIPDEPLPVDISIRPTTLNVNAKGVFTVFVTLRGGDSLFPPGKNRKSGVDFGNSSLTCGGAEMISAGVSNKGGGTLIAKFHRQDLENVTSGAGVQINCSGTILVGGKSVDVEGSDTIRVIGEKKGLDKVISGLMKFLGLEKDDISVNRTEDGNITVSFTLDPDNFKNNGQLKKAARNIGTTPAGKQNATEKVGPQLETVKGNGKDKDNNGKDKGGIQTGNAAKNAGKGNKDIADNDTSDGKSNGKKNT